MTGPAGHEGASEAPPPTCASSSSRCTRASSTSMRPSGPEHRDTWSRRVADRDLVEACRATRPGRAVFCIRARSTPFDQRLPTGARGRDGEAPSRSAHPPRETEVIKLVAESYNQSANRRDTRHQREDSRSPPLEHPRESSACVTRVELTRLRDPKRPSSKRDGPHGLAEKNRFQGSHVPQATGPRQEVARASRLVMAQVGKRARTPHAPSPSRPRRTRTSPRHAGQKVVARATQAHRRANRRARARPSGPKAIVTAHRAIELDDGGTR